MSQKVALSLTIAQTKTVSFRPRPITVFDKLIIQIEIVHQALILFSISPVYCSLLQFCLEFSY